MDRTLEAEAKALLRAARARLAELVEEELAWLPKSEPAARARPQLAASPRLGDDGARREATGAADSPAPLGSRPEGEREPSRSALARVRERLGDCTRCPLHAGRKSIVFGDGDPDAEIMFIGEGPGEQEDLRGLPFVGRAGELLTRMIENGLGIPRASVYIANIVKCRPPGNRTPLPNEVSACREFLDGQIDAIRPKVVVALGKPATSLLLGRDVSITRVRGTWHEYRGYPVMPTFHPAFLLRQYTPENRRLVWEDLKAALERTRTS